MSIELKIINCWIFFSSRGSNQLESHGENKITFSFFHWMKAEKKLEMGEFCFCFCVVFFLPLCFALLSLSLHVSVRNESEKNYCCCCCCTNSQHSLRYRLRSANESKQSSVKWWWKRMPRRTVVEKSKQNTFGPHHFEFHHFAYFPNKKRKKLKAKHKQSVVCFMNKFT